MLPCHCGGTAACQELRRFNAKLDSSRLGCTATQAAREYTTTIARKAAAAGLTVNKENSVTIRVPGSVAYRDTVLDEVAALCRRATNTACGRVSQQFVDELVSAVGEAFNNIAIHAYEGATVDEVQVDVSFDGKEVTATLRDFGKHFDPDAVEPPSLAELPESGLGVYIIRAYVDGVTYTPGRPNTLTLRKWLRGAVPVGPHR